MILRVYNRLSTAEAQVGMIAGGADKPHAVIQIVKWTHSAAR